MQAPTETSGNPVLTHGDDDEWSAEVLTRIDANIAGLVNQIEHIDINIHGLQQTLDAVMQTLAPLRDHPEAVAKGLSLLDPGSGVRKFITGRKGGKG
jgi:hypothetical protein